MILGGRTPTAEIRAALEAAEVRHRQYADGHERGCPCNECIALRAAYGHWWRYERIPTNLSISVRRQTLAELCDRLEAAEAEVAAVRELAESWRYEGEFGWGPWQEGNGPDFEGQVLDDAARAILRALDGEQP